MASVLGLAIATFGISNGLGAQVYGPRPSVPQRPPMPGIEKTLQESYQSKSGDEKSQKAACLPIQEVQGVNGCTSGGGIGIYGGATSEEAGGVEIYNEAATSSRGGAVSIFSNAVTSGNKNEGGFIDFSTKWMEDGTFIKGWRQQMIIRPNWEDASELGTVGIGEEWPTDRLVVNGTVRGINFRLEPNGVWTWGGFGGAGFGLDRGYFDPFGNNAGAPISGQTLSAANTPVLLQGLSGVGIATENARLALNANGSICMGFGTQEVLPVAGLAANSNQVLGNSLFLKKGLTTYDNPQFIISNEEAGARLELYSKDAPGRKGNIGLITRTDNGSVGDFDLVSQNGSSYRSNLSVKADGTTSINGNTTVNGEFKVAGNNPNTPGGTEFRVDGSGFVWARDIRVDFDPIPDYVFDPSYKLMPLEELKAYLAQHKHLPNIPSAAEYEARGSLSVSEINIKLLEKVEELTLYVLQLKNEIDSLKSK